MGCRFASAAVLAVGLNGIALPIFGAAAVMASEMIYTPINPSFGGNPLNSSQLLAVAGAQKPDPPQKTSTGQQQTASQQFLQMLQSQLYASLASSVATAITGKNAAGQGSITLGNTRVSWYTDLEGKHITLTDGTTGQVTQIVLPVVDATP